MSDKTPEAQHTVWKIALAALAVAMLAACSGADRTPQNADTAELLSALVDSAGLTVTSEIECYVGDSLFEYINGGAELYHTYDFRDVSVAYCKLGEEELTVDLYRFADPTAAYALYTMVRPEGINTIPIGVEGFSSESTVDFVKGNQLVRLTSFSTSGGGEQDLLRTARSIDNHLPGTTARPERFAAFPTAEQLPATDKIFADSFLGRQFLTDVYVNSYQYQDSRFTLFLTDDPGGEKFLRLQKQLSQVIEAPSDFRFDMGNSLMFEDDYHGRIVVGLKSGRLAGVVGFSDHLLEFCASWIDSLK